MTITTIPHQNVTEIDLLIAIRDRLRQRVDWCSESNCYITRQQIPSVVSATAPFATILYDDSSHDTNYYDGGGPMQTKMDVNILISIITRCGLDQPPKSELALIDDQVGALTYRNQVLQALLVSDDSCEHYRSPWNPVNVVTGVPFLRDYGLRLARASGLRDLSTDKLNLMGTVCHFVGTMDLYLPAF